MKKHVRYVDAARLAAVSNWGRSCENAEEVEKGLLENLDITGACAMYFLRVFELALDAILEDHLRMWTLRLCERRDRCVDEAVAELEVRHGPCPPKVRDALRKAISDSIGRQLLNGYSPYSMYVSYGLPEKGTEGRRAYDAWRRKRAKKGKSEGRGDDHVGD